MDTIVTMRNGSYCLAVKSEFKTKLPGVVHDQSSTGSTVFIEPLVAVRLNNEYRELTLAEQQEISKDTRISQRPARPVYGGAPRKSEDTGNA